MDLLLSGEESGMKFYHKVMGGKREIFTHRKGKRKVECIKYFPREDNVQVLQRRLYQGYKFVISKRGTVFFHEI